MMDLWLDLSINRFLDGLLDLGMVQMMDRMVNLLLVDGFMEGLIDC